MAKSKIGIFIKGALFIGVMLLVLAFAQVALENVVDKSQQGLVGVFSSNPQVQISLEVAADERARTLGLMHRTDVTETKGMVFVFPDLAKHDFWMRNTPLSLDMIHLDEQQNVVGIVSAATPFSQEILSIGVPSKYVIELKAGAVAALGVAPGIRFESDGLAGVLAK
jgi:uncharacterized protein